MRRARSSERRARGWHDAADPTSVSVPNSAVLSQDSKGAVGKMASFLSLCVTVSPLRSGELTLQFEAEQPEAVVLPCGCFCRSLCRVVTEEGSVTFLFSPVVPVGAAVAAGRQL